MNHYTMTVRPTDGRAPVTFDGEAICFADACLLARRLVEPELGDNQTTTAPRSFSQTSEVTRTLPVVSVSVRGR